MDITIVGDILFASIALKNNEIHIIKTFT